jgi:hypothetical protein
MRPRVMLDLIEHMLATLSAVVVEQLPDVTVGGVLQLLLELGFLQAKRALSALCCPLYSSLWECKQARAFM